MKANVTVKTQQNTNETTKIVNSIIQFHNEVEAAMTAYKDNARKAISAAVNAGKLLLQQKELHRKSKSFGIWLESYIPFSSSTALRYMRLARLAKKQKFDEAKSLRHAYQMAGIVAATKKKAVKKDKVTGEVLADPYKLLDQLMKVLPTYTGAELEKVLEKLADTVIKFYNSKTATKSLKRYANVEASMEAPATTKSKADKETEEMVAVLAE